MNCCILYKEDLRLLHTLFSLPGLQEQNYIFHFLASLGVPTACSPGRTVFSPPVSEYYCVIGQKCEAGVVIAQILNSNG